MDATTLSGGRSPSNGIRRPIGELFVELGLISDEQLALALEIQGRTGLRLGEVLVEQGFVTRLDLAGALAAQWEPAAISGSRDLSAASNGSDPAHAVVQGDALGQQFEVADLGARVDALVERLDGVGAVEATLAELGAELAEMRTIRVNDALATGARLAGLEAAVGALRDVEAPSAADLERALADAAAENARRVSDLRADLDALSSRPVVDDPGERLVELAARIDGLARDEQDRAAELGTDVDRRLDRLEAQLEELRERDQAGVMGPAAAELEARTAALELQALSHREEVAGAGVRIDEVLAAAAERAAAASRLETELRRESEDALIPLRTDLASLEARLDEIIALRQSDARALAARVAKIEAALPGHDTELLVARLDELEARAEVAEAIADMRTQATERAIRDGLASLGKRIVGSGGGRKPGKRMRRSIERLGAAIADADARTQKNPSAGHIAFAPTTDGYRLIELPDAPPDVGATVELESSGERLVVTRKGRSPIPFDGRVCVYLDRT